MLLRTRRLLPSGLTRRLFTPKRGNQKTIYLQEGQLGDYSLNNIGGAGQNQNKIQYRHRYIYIYAYNVSRCISKDDNSAVWWTT